MANGFEKHTDAGQSVAQYAIYRGRSVTSSGFRPPFDYGPHRLNDHGQRPQEQRADALVEHDVAQELCFVGLERNIGVPLP